jgi:translation initiation factor 3 subunit M
LQVDTAEVEKWVIDGMLPILDCRPSCSITSLVIRADLLSGKLSQTKQSLYITRSTARTFEREQWEALEKRLLAWKSGLNNVLEVVANARRQAGGHVPTQTATAAA